MSNVPLWLTAAVRADAASRHARISRTGTAMEFLHNKVALVDASQNQR